MPTGAVHYPCNVDRRPGAAVRVSSVLGTVAIQGLASHTVELLVLPRPAGGAAGYSQLSLELGYASTAGIIRARMPALKRSTDCLSGSGGRPFCDWYGNLWNRYRRCVRRQQPRRTKGLQRLRGKGFSSGYSMLSAVMSNCRI